MKNIDHLLIMQQPYLSQISLLFVPFRAFLFLFSQSATFLTNGASLLMNVDREMMIGCRVRTEKKLL